MSLVERGRIDRIAVGRLRSIAAALDAELVLTLRWRGGDLDRLVDEGHAALVGHVVAWLQRLGWEVHPEVTFAVYAERGSIDVLAWHGATRTLLVVEVKTELTSVEETLRRLDVKARVAARVAGERFGFRPEHVARLLVLRDTATARRRVGRHGAVLSAAYPLRGDDARAWLRQPSGPASGLVFVSDRATIDPVARRRIRGFRCSRSAAPGR